MSAGERADRLNILGIPVDRVSRAEAAAIFADLMRGRECALIVTPNSEILWNASQNPALKEVIQGARLVIPDGIGLVYASRILGKPLAERVTGIDFLSEILTHLAANGKSVFLFGSAPGTAEKAGAGMAAAYPGLRVAGTRHGYFSPEEEAGIVADINESGADFLCVALGSPKQEFFIAAHGRELTAARAAMGVGGSLDVWAGNVKRAPAFYRDHGLEWLYRLMKQPERIGRMAALPLFMLKVLLSGAANKEGRSSR